MHRSALLAYLGSVLRGQLLSVAFSLVRTFGIIGGASRVLGVLSASVAKLADAES